MKGDFQITMSQKPLTWPPRGQFSVASSCFQPTGCEADSCGFHIKINSITIKILLAFRLQTSSCCIGFKFSHQCLGRVLSSVTRQQMFTDILAAVHSSKVSANNVLDLHGITSQRNSILSVFIKCSDAFQL